MALLLQSALLCLLVLKTAQAATSFKVDLGSTSTKPVWPFWESCTSFDHAYLALRQDWQQQLKTTHDELGTKTVRFFGIFDDDIGVANPAYPSAAYSYWNIDVIYDYILSIGMKPIVELDFVPSTFLADPASHLSESFPTFNVYKGPPDNNTQWAGLITDFVTHLVDRYGMDEVTQWVFDFWDEPNTGKWINNNLTTFEETFLVTIKALRAINESFYIGAPGTANAVWIPDFPEWATKNKIGLKWVSTHLYPTNGYCSNRTHNGFYLCLQRLSDVVKGIDPALQVGITAYGCTLQPLNGDIGPHDTSYNSACFTTMASQWQELDTRQFNVMSFTGFTDIWDQHGVYSAPFHNGYGWLTNRGLRKATYHALRLLHTYATDRMYFTELNRHLNQSTTTLELFATLNAAKDELALFVMNWMLEGTSIVSQTVQITIEAYTKSAKSATLYRIDDKNCNPQVIWQSMGSPVYPTDAQMAAMVNVSNTYPQTIDASATNTNSITFTLDVPVYGLALIILPV